MHKLRSQFKWLQHLWNPTHRGIQGTSNWRDYIFYLVCEYLGIPEEQLKDMIEK